MNAHTKSEQKGQATRKAWVAVAGDAAARHGAAAATLGHSAVGPPKRPRSAAAWQPIEAAALPDALLKVRTVSAVTGLSASSIYRKIAAGKFPEPVRLGARCTRWKSCSVTAWLAAQCTSAAAAE